MTNRNVEQLAETKEKQKKNCQNLKTLDLLYFMGQIKRDKIKIIILHFQEGKPLPLQEEV